MKNMGNIVYYSVIALIVAIVVIGFICLKCYESRVVDRWFRNYLKGIYNTVNKEKPIENLKSVQTVLELDNKKLREIGLSSKEYFDWSKLSDVERREISLRLQMMEKEFNIQIKNYILSAILPIFSLYRELLPSVIHRIIISFGVAVDKQAISDLIIILMITLLIISVISLYCGISLNSKIHERKMFAIYLKKRLERYEMLNMNREA